MPRKKAEPEVRPEVETEIHLAEGEMPAAPSEDMAAELGTSPEEVTVSIERMEDKAEEDRATAEEGPTEDSGQEWMPPAGEKQGAEQGEAASADGTEEFMPSQGVSEEDETNGAATEGKGALAEPAQPEPTGQGPTQEEPLAVHTDTAAPATPAEKDFYHLDFHTLDRGLSPEQRQEWNSIYASYRGRSAMTGTIVGIDRHAINVRDRKTGEMVRHEMYCAIVIPFRVRILIPETEMWTQGQERPSYVLRNMAGAEIDFVILHVDRENGFAIASRRQAARTRRYYFSTMPALHRTGARIPCRVLAVGPRRCLVECYGHDINLTQRELRYAAIPDLREQYHPGQTLECVVKEYDREQEALEISVKETNPNPFDGARERHPVGCTRQAVIAGKYAGGVFCNLPDGAVCMCSYAFHYDDASFEIGDTVMVLIQRYEMTKKQIYGKIVAKW